MNRKVTNLLVIYTSTITFFCSCQTIIFHKTESTGEQTIVNVVPTKFHCPLSNSTKSLNLNYTGLQKLPVDFIAPVPITCLNLKGNQLRYIHRGILDSFPNLTFLNLADNRIRNNDLFSMGPHEKLSTLILDDNTEMDYPLETGLRCLYKFPNLKKLYVRGNQIKFFDDECREFNFPKLTHLYLSRNTEKTGSLEASIDNIPKNLNHLEFEDNGICRFNGSIFKNMSTLHIDGNQFQCLGIANHSYLNVTNMPRLRILAASRCEMRTINVDAFAGTENLEILNLTVNYLEKILENTFKKFTLLKIVSLTYNRFQSIPKEACLSSLMQLDLNYNFISIIHQDSLTNCVALEKLSLRGNNIRVVEKNAFTNLAKLTDLDLRENQLGELYVNWATDLKTLRNLNLISNPISSTEFLQLENSTAENVLLGSTNMKNVTIVKSRKNLILHFNLDVDSEKSTNFRHRYSKHYHIECKK